MEGKRNRIGGVRGMVNDKESHLEMAKALDGMPKSLPSDNADFLDRVLKSLKAGKVLKEKDGNKLENLYGRYFSKREEDAEGEEEEKEKEKEEEAEEDGEKPAEDDVDEDDFV